MIIHILIDIAQKARRNNTHPAKRNADQVHPPVALRICNLPRFHDNLPRRVIARDTGYQLDFFEEGGASEGDGGFNGFWAGDAEFKLHGAADVVDGVGDEFGDEDVVIGRVADGATNDADGKGECCDGRDEVLKGCQWGGAWGREWARMERTSGQMMVVMIEAGTTMPPIPRPARTRRPHAR